MRINELLVESQQLDEGPFTQAIGKVGGKIAKGVANVGKDLKTGFKAGYDGEQPADATATTPATANPTDAPATKSGGIKGALNSFKQGFTKGYKGAAAPAADTADPTTTNTSTAPANTTAPAADPAAPANTAAPAANPEAEKAAKIGVGQINKIIPTLRTRDLMSLQANLEKVIASKKKAPPADAAPAAPAADAATTTAPAAPGSDAAKDELYGAGNRPKGAKDKVAALKSQNKKKAVAPPQAEIDAERERLMGVTSDSIIRKGPVMAESFSLYRKH
jgi:hypothetical protein